MACEFAGQADSLAHFYNVIIDGADATSPIPKNRWNIPLEQLPTSILHGGFLRRNPWDFDQQFFSISPKEAARIDPQHRILLENTYHALEDASIDPIDIKGTKCGVFIGLGTQDYSRIMHNSGDFKGLHSKGSLGSMAAGRISYHFDLVGPSFVVDTACSSSLVALHQAVKALQLDQCDLAVVGGATLILTVDYSVDLASAGLMAKDGRCKPFSRYADGFARGEGAGVIILQRHHEAISAKRRIYANILGSAINGDGKTNGITAPSKESQKRVIKDALLDANISPEQVSYIETHGTGTDLGDKIEFAALCDVYQGRKNPLYLGSVKGNIAHCEAAAGIAGVIKTSLCIYNNVIPPHTAAHAVNPELRHDLLNVKFPQQVIQNKKIIGSVSSFGMSGSNAHVLLGFVEPNACPIINEKIKFPFLFLSAKSAESFIKLRDEYHNLLESCSDATLKEILHKSNMSRKNWPNYRELIYGNDRVEFINKLNKISLKSIQEDSHRRKRKIAFLFTGQGAIYKDMTRLLYDTVTLYRNIFDKYAAKIDASIQLPQKIKNYIFSDLNNLNNIEDSDSSAHFFENTQAAQLSLFLIEFSLVELFAALGVKPDYVVGHSLGEYAAACCAGILSFEHAVRMIIVRSQETDNAHALTKGVMLQIYARAEVVESILNEIRLSNPNLQLWLSVYNAPEIQVVSGTIDAIEELIINLKHRRLHHSKLNTTHAFHTPLFAPAAACFKNNLAGYDIDFLDQPASTVNFISTVEGDSTGKNFRNLSYWEAQIVQPVRFNQAIDTCYQLGVNCFIELGPDSILTALASQALKTADKIQELEFIPANIKNKTNLDAFFKVLNNLYVCDRLDCSKLNLITGGEYAYQDTSSLPLYPFARTELLPEYLKKNSLFLTPKTPIISDRLDMAVMPTRLEFQINLDLSNSHDAYIAQHVINNICLLPGSYYAGASIYLIEKLINDYGANKEFSIEIKNLFILRPVIFDETGKENLKVVISQQETNQYKLTYFRLSDLGKAVCELTVFLNVADEPICTLPVHATLARQSVENFYLEYAACGVNYGPLFKRLQTYYWLDANNIIAEILPPDDHNEKYSSTHAVFLDNCFQTIALVLNKLNHAYAPTTIMKCKYYKQERWNSVMKCLAEMTAHTEDYLEANLTIYNSKHEVLMEIMGIACQAVDLRHLQENIVHHVKFEKVEVTSSFDNCHEKFGAIADLKNNNAMTMLSLLSKRQAAIPTVKFSDFVKGEEITESHLICLVDSAGNMNSKSVFQLFTEVYNALRQLDDKSPGRLKIFSIVSSALTHSPKDLMGSLLRAMVLAFPTEFPTIQFRYFCYDSFTQDNINYIFHANTFEDIHSTNNIAAPFWHIRENELFRYKTTPNLIPSEIVELKKIKTEGYYLITGGLGGIGKQVIKHLVSVLSCKNIIITYRKPESLTQDNIRFIEDLRSQHAANIICECVDLTIESQLVELFRIMPRPLYGIFHLAGINVDQTLAKTTLNSMNNALSVKYNSAWMLHELSLGFSELEYFVLFSSVATLISSPGQFDYALANLGLIDLAEYRNNLNLPMTIIDWGPWKNTGMMASLSGSSTSSVALRNFNALEPSTCCESLFACLTQQSNGSNDYHFAVFKLNQKSNISQHTSIHIESNNIESKPEINQFSKKEDVANFVNDLLITLIAQETNHKISSIDDSVALSELGLDSINTIRIRAELQTQLNLSIPLSLLLDDPSISSITNQLSLLWLDNHKNHKHSSPIVDPDSSLSKVSENQFYPLSYNQFSIWYEQQATLNNTAYYCSIGWKIQGDAINLNHCRDTWKSLLQKHEMLRALFTHEEGELGYKILTLSEALQQTTIVVEDLKSDVDVDNYLKICLTKKIDFQNELPTKIFIIRKKNDVYLMLSSHHIVMDAAAMFHVGEKLLRALCEPGFILDLVPISASYREFTDFQKQQKPEYENKAMQFLLKEALDENNNLRTFELPKNNIARPVNLALGGSTQVIFDDHEMQTIMSLPVNMRVHICLSAWALLLARYTGENNILVGIAFNGRTQKKWTDIIGHFVNVLPMNISVDQHDTCFNFLNAVKRHLIDLLEFQDLPLVKLMMHDSVKDALQGRKLLQTYFNYFDASELDIKINNPSLQIQSLLYPQQEAQFEISLWVTRDVDQYSFDIKYQSDLFSDSVLANLAQHYKKIILSLSNALLENEKLPRLCDIKLFSPEEESKLLPAETEVSEHTTFVYQYFNEHVLQTPQAIAIEMKDQHISYKQLYAYVEKLAAAMREFPHLSNDETVAILSPERANIEFIISVLALWKQGFAYLPLNTHHPLERIKYAINAVDCKKIIIIDESLSAEIRDYVLSLDDMLALDVRLNTTALNIQVVKQPASQLTQHTQQSIESKLAYVLFTSGSTGFPKGVLVEHDGLIDRLLWMKSYFNFSAQDKFLQSTILTFDVSLPEFCLPLMSGGTTVLFHPDENPNAHAKICQNHLITMMSTVPSLFSILQDDLSACQSLRHLILIGEVLPPAIVNQWLESDSPCTLYNLYGPTEVTVYATAFACRAPVKSSLVPIGAPSQNVIALVLDSYGNLVPQGVVGELYLSGTGVARGYLGKVVENPFANNPFQSRYSRIYKTGDFVRWLDHNTIEYIGRKDNRIKLHGLLIELGEIEQRTLKTFPSIKNASAIIIDFKSADNINMTKHIVLCVMPLFSDIDQIMSHLEQHLPNYMLPWKIFSYTDFPRNSSGKVDRKALSEIVRQSCEQESVLTVAKGVTQNTVVFSYLEKECIKIWESFLQKNNIGLDDNFFQLGGNSLLLTQMTLLVEKRLSVNINFSKFLSNPTINSLINGITTKSSSWATELNLSAGIATFRQTEKTNAVLLTGATGHLGIHLLRALLECTDKKIYLIVRADSIEHACDRLNERYKNVFCSSINFSRVCVYAGDLTHPTLGLDKAIFSDVCQKISIIIHSAAEVNHVVDYVRLKTNNVIATKNIIDVAYLSNCAHLFHISTQFSEIDFLPESYMEDALINKFISGYEQSKFIAESLMHAATKQSYPITTLRLPLIIDGHDPYLLKQNHFVAFIMKCLRMGFYPDLLHSFDVLPTEQIALFVAKRCVEISPHSQIYNCLQHAINLTDIFDFFKTHTDLRATKIDYPSWRDRVIDSTEVSDPFYKLLPLYTATSFSLNENIPRKIENTSYLKQINNLIDHTSFEHVEKICRFLADFYLKMGTLTQLVF